MLIKDIFYSFQGEGPFVGYPQVFIRFFGCNIHCAYCDEPDLPEQKKHLSVADVQAALAVFEGKPIHSISLTGGEPLLHVSSIKILAPYLKQALYLESNALLPSALDEVKSLFTYFSMDYKSGYAKAFAESMLILKRFEETTSKEIHIFVKYVMVPNYNRKDIIEITTILSDLNWTHLPFVIQPVTPYGNIQNSPSAEEIEEAYISASRVLCDVRIIPQTHKMIGLK